MNTKDNRILPVPAGIHRPLWSVMIPTYNPGKYIYDAIESVLVQDIPQDKMQIEIVDDCSNKVDVEKIVNDNWKGRVNYHRLPKNVGHSFNFTESVRRANGELVHILHDDDRVLPDFYKTFEEIFEEYQSVGAAFCRQRYIDEEGNLLFHSEPEMESRGLLEDAVVKLAQMQRIQYCAMVVRRKVYEQLGGFVMKNIGCEDWEMWVRIASKFPIAYEPKDLAEYRVHHGTSMTLKDMRSGQDMRFMREAISMFREYVPEEKRKETDLFRSIHYGEYSFRNGNKLLNEHKDEEGAAAQWNETIVFDPEVVFKNIKIVENVSIPIHNTGVSVIADCRGDEKTFNKTLRHLAGQKVPKYIPWEIVIVTAKGSRNSLASNEVLDQFKENKINYRFIELDEVSEIDFIKMSLETSEYNFVMFCRAGEFPENNYVASASLNMLRDRKLGALGGYTESVFEGKKIPDWVKKWNDIYETGEQFEYTNVLTWNKGFIWNSGMVIRKDFWKEMMKEDFEKNDQNFLQEFRDDIRRQIGRRLKDRGWNIWYSTDLRLKKQIRADDIKWSSFRKKYVAAKFDELAAKLYQKADKNSGPAYRTIQRRLSARKSVERTFRKLMKYDKRKLRNFHEVQKYDEDVLNIIFLFKLLKIQLTGIGAYNKKLRLLKRISYKRDLQLIARAFTNRYFRYPQYINPETKDGISMMLYFGNSSYHYLAKALENLTAQRVPENFPWEVNVISNFIKDDVKEKLNADWKNSRTGASLNFYDLSQKDFDNFNSDAIVKSRYKNLVMINEFDYPERDYVRVADRIMKTYRQAVIAGGQTIEASEVRLPKWFKEYKTLYGIGKIGDYPEEITYQNRNLWKSGIIIKKSFLNEIVRNSSDGSNEIKAAEVSDNYEKQYSSYARLSGLGILYHPRLVCRHLIPVEKLNWEYLKELHYVNGANRVFESLRNEDSEPDSWIISCNKTLGQMKNYPIKKIIFRSSNEKPDDEVLEIESLKGRFSKLLRSRREYNKSLKSFTAKTSNGRHNGHSNGKAKITEKGVSVVICCFNSSKVIEETLKHICRQKVSLEIPWEVVIVDNASTDNTAEIAKRFWQEHNVLVPLRVVNENKPGLAAARLRGVHSAKFEYIIFCDDDNRLSDDFVRNAFRIMEQDEKIGILGGRSMAVFESEPPEWFDLWKDSYAVGEQSKESSADVTKSRGYLWGASMIIRKSAMRQLLSKGFRSLLTDRKGAVLSSGGDTEICYALRNEGWKLCYDSRLKFKHYITDDRLNWSYIGKLFTGFGQASPGLDYYLRKYSESTQANAKKRKTLRQEIRLTLLKLRKTNYEKLLLGSIVPEGDTDIPMLKYCVGRLQGLLKKRKSYNKAVRLLKRTATKNDLRILKTSFRGYSRNFPRYMFEKKLNGVSVIVCTYNGAARLPDTIRHLALQKVEKNILWEVILVDNASTDNSKQAAINEWKKHNCGAKLRIIDQPIPGKQLALEKGYEIANYEFLITCDDDNWLEENFVQYVFEVMYKNDHIGVLGGPNDALCEVEPPEWFKHFQKDYAAGEQGEIYTGEVAKGDITWKRGFVWGAGMVVRKSAWEKLIRDGFKTSMRCRTGEELTSGGDSEACYALVLAGWQIWYDPRLKLKHCMPAGRLEWNYLIRLFRGFGVASVGLEIYEKAIKLGRADIDEKELMSQGWWYEVKKTIRELRKYGAGKILSLRFPQDNNTNIVMLEFNLYRLKELIRIRKEYDERYKQLQNAPWKKSYKELRRNHREYIEKENDIRYGWPWSNECASVPPADSANKKFPKISVLTPSYNSSGTIEKAVMSVVMQKYPCFEHIVCDGGSQDNTVEILKKFPHLRWISEKDKGQSDAMNKAFTMSDGDIVVYLNADDYFARNAFYKIAEAFEKNPETDMVVGNLFFDYVDHTFVRKPEIEYRKIMQPFKYMFPINPVSYFYKRKIQEEIGEFPLDNHMTMDYWFLLRAYQNYKLTKIEDYLGTFYMNGLNKTSTADNRKNTHDRVVYHCRNYDRKLLPFYLFNYYKFFYYDKKPYNLTRISYTLRRNTRRAISLLTFKKNKHYSYRAYLRGRYRFFEGNKLRAASLIFLSFLIYPKSLKKKERSNLLLQALLWNSAYEKIMEAYRFFAYPPGMSLSHKLQYYGTENKNSGKKLKGSLLLVLSFLFAPFQKRNKATGTEERTFSYSKKISILNSGQRSETAYNLYIRAQEKYYYHKNLRALFFLFSSFTLNPSSAFKKSRLNFLAYTALGKSMTDELKILYHIYKDNPELTLPHKLNYYGNRLRKENHSIKGNTILFFTYILSPKYISQREKIEKSKIVFASEIQVPKKHSSSRNFDFGNKYRTTKTLLSYELNPAVMLSNAASRTAYSFKSAYHYFRYRKFKARSKELYSKAIEAYNSNNRKKAFSMLFRSYLLYPVSITNKNKFSLTLNSLLGNSFVSKLKNVLK